MRMTSTIPDRADCCEAVLDGLVDATVILIREGRVPPFPHDVVGIHYRLEPPGEEDWKLAPGVIRDGWGDCEDLAIWTAAGIRATGRDPFGTPCEDAWVRIVRTGRGKLHALVERADGTFEDPSVELMRPQDLQRFTDAPNSSPRPGR